MKACRFRGAENEVVLLADQHPELSQSIAVCLEVIRARFVQGQLKAARCVLRDLDRVNAAPGQLVLLKLLEASIVLHERMAVQESLTLEEEAIRDLRQREITLATRAEAHFLFYRLRLAAASVFEADANSTTATLSSLTQLTGELEAAGLLHESFAAQQILAERQSTPGERLRQLEP